MQFPREPGKGVTLIQHITRRQRAIHATGEFSNVLTQISLAAKVIARALSQAGLFDRQDYAESSHSRDTTHRHLDRFAHETFVKVFSMSPWVSTLVSEEMDEPLHFEDRGKVGKYIVFVDPLESASNLDVNGLAGTIFSVYSRSSKGGRSGEKNLLRRGLEQRAAGYIHYGPSTVLVYTSGDGVNAYTLDSGIGEFLISQENIRIPERGLTYSCNEAYFHDWHPYTRSYLETLRSRHPRSDKHYSSRYAGSLVANFHRTLIRGGVFLHPADTVSNTGQLSLMYACNPLAYIAEQAGGAATTGTERILRITPKTHHQRSPMVIGSPYEVALYEDFAKGRKS